MIQFAIDFETTGLDTANDRVIEFGGVLYSTGMHKCVDTQGMLVQTDKEITQEIVDLTNCHPAAVKRFGYSEDDIFNVIMGMADQCDVFLGHNVRRFDYAVLFNWAHRNNVKLPNKPWIDTFDDLPWRVPRGKLTHMMADHGFINNYPHSAIADAQGSLLIASKYDPDLLLQRATSPTVILRSHQPQIDNNIVKKPPFSFRWSPSKKWWWKAAKQQDVDEIMSAATAKFKISIEKEASERELDQ